MKELTYNPYFLYSDSKFDIVRMQTNNILILVHNKFIKKEEVAIKTSKIMTKSPKHLTFLYLLKFNRIQIKLDLEEIVFTKEN